MSQLKYSRDGVVSFDYVTHTYMMGDRKLQGITSLISRYKNKFDADAVATTYAEKHGLDKEKVLAEWAEKSRISLENGSAVHKVFEDYIETGNILFTGNYLKEIVAVKFIQEMFQSCRLIPVAAELIVYNDVVASQIDCIARDKVGNHYILDWKTNAKIERNGYGKRLKFPFNSLPDASFYHYSLQVALYKELCKEYNIKGCYIVHIGDDNYDILRPEQITVKSFLATLKTPVNA